MSKRDQVTSPVCSRLLKCIVPPLRTLSSFTEYVDLCKFLGLAWSKTEQGYVVAPDGFIMRGRKKREGRTSTFKDSPVQFLKVLMTKIRRNCEGIDKTHLGAILDGRLLLPSDFGEPEDDFHHRPEKSS
jgi:hypothetical protein